MILDKRKGRQNNHIKNEIKHNAPLSKIYSQHLNYKVRFTFGQHLVTPL